MQRLLIILFLAGFTACYNTRPSNGGGQRTSTTARVITTTDVKLPTGYTIEVVADSLNFPTALATDNNGHLYVTESGYAYGEVFTSARLIRIDGKNKTTIATGGKNGPWTSVRFHNGKFFISEGGQMEGGRILSIDLHGNKTVLADSLPGFGDHHTNSIAIRNGYIYFGQGTATNAGVVGPDNAESGWLERKKGFHDIPCLDITLNGVNYKNDSTTTGAYVPYGTTTTAGQVIRGATPCSGAILRIPEQGGETEWVAWGFRNPYGLAFSPQGVLYATENGYDVRGSRPVWGAGDVFWKVMPGFWYGWPDYSAAKKIWDDEEFAVHRNKKVKKLLQADPGTPPKPVSIFAVHSSSNGFDFSTSQQFGYEGNAFVAQFGDMSGNVGKVLQPVGFKVVRVDTLTGVVRDFAVNNSRKSGPASRLKQGGLERPVSVTFSSDGRDMYIVDFGIMLIKGDRTEPLPFTGVIWRVRRS